MTIFSGRSPTEVRNQVVAWYRDNGADVTCKLEGREARLLRPMGDTHHLILSSPEEHATVSVNYYGYDFGAMSPDECAFAWKNPVDSPWTCSITVQDWKQRDDRDLLRKN